MLGCEKKLSLSQVRYLHTGGPRDQSVVAPGLCTCVVCAEESGEACRKTFSALTLGIGRGLGDPTTRAVCSILTVVLACSRFHGEGIRGVRGSKTEQKHWRVLSCSWLVCTSLPGSLPPLPAEQGDFRWLSVLIREDALVIPDARPEIGRQHHPGYLILA